MFKSGQALLVVLLMLGVALTIGISIASRSTTEVEISTTQQEAARALEAAETGIEKALGGVVVGNVVDHLGHQVTDLQHLTDLGGKDHDARYRRTQGL